MAISAVQVKELRDKTGAGMMNCKKALTEADGNFEKAIEILRKKGASVAAKRAERDANEGIVKTKVSDDGKFGVILEVNCETDFVAKSDDFVNFAEFVLNAIVSEKPADVEALKSLTFDGKVVNDELTNITGKIGEKIEISRFQLEEGDDLALVDYIHHGAKLGVLVKAENVGNVDYSVLSSVLKDVAMQAAAMKPRFLSVSEVPNEVIEKEKEIYKEVAKKEGKPDHILDKIADGRLNKFYQEVCLLKQAYIKENAKTIADVIAEFNKANSSEVKLTAFFRYHLSDENK
ncbi:MAG: translation elongation factor Ts [Bacteroidetes bacterium]|nr:translation elongation factor Ts [Bacteroidota bacterium]MBU1678597.1 translation elongation factor Ts [Bacteroidota bacterium]MBU2506319.1 translation elongation factor Ts [Bacteroidota bacterium]